MIVEFLSNSSGLQFPVLFRPSDPDGPGTLLPVNLDLEPQSSCLKSPAAFSGAGDDSVRWKQHGNFVDRTSLSLDGPGSSTLNVPRPQVKVYEVIMCSGLIFPTETILFLPCNVYNALQDFNRLFID